jgi:hypothetical protein
MNRLLDFYSEALKTVSGSSPEHVQVLDRIMLQANFQLSQDRLITLIERLVAPQSAVSATPNAQTTEDLLGLLEKMQGEEAPEKAVHPSIFSDIDLGPDEVRLTPEEQEADTQLREEIAVATQAATQALLTKRKGNK